MCCCNKVNLIAVLLVHKHIIKIARLRIIMKYNEVVPICAMEADRLSGGIAPLLPKLGCRWMCVVRLSALATLRPKKYLWY